MATLKQKRNSELLRPVSKKTLAEEVAIILKRFILTEKLKEGDKLPPERELATTLGVSHRVVREALSILAGQGIIGKKHGRGAFVRAFDANRLQAAQAALLPSLDVAEFYKLRRAIEVGAICLAVERATEEDLAELQEILEVMKPKSEREESITADEMRFHLTLLRATHEEIFYQLDYLIVEAIRLKVYDKPRRLYRNERNPSTMMEHQAIIDALRRRDGKRAVYEMHKHFDSMMRTTGFVEKPNRNLGNGRRSPSGNPES